MSASLHRPARLGSFTLHQRLGEGAMGEVLRGEGPQGLSVAIKRMRSGTEFQTRLRQLFADEVRVAARFVHPHIALIYDVGLDREQPWLAMELASAQTLAQRAGRCSWTQLQAWMAATLDALAYVHARGIVHRDIKPENLLLCGAEDPRPGLKVADFGIAWHMGQRPARVVGTPDFWAPEQAAGDSRRMGPWSDLFAVGRTALHLAGTGELGWARIRSVGAREWLEGLLEPDPRERFRYAADARHALLALSSEASWTGVDGLAATPAPSATFDFADEPARPEPPAPRARASRTRAPWPTSWVPTRQPPSALPGVGTSLGRLRERPLFGRHEAQEALGELLRDRRGGAVVEVLGPSGTGTSSLAQSFVQRALETGVAQVLRVGAELESPMRGVLGAWELEGHSLRRQLASVLGWDDLAPLLAWLEGEVGAPEGQPLGRMLLRALHTLDPVRPWILLLESPPGPRLASLLRTMIQGELGVMLLCTRDPSAEGIFPGAHTLRLPALASEDLAGLLDATLRLEPWARSALVSRAKGSPRLLLELLWHAMDLGLVVHRRLRGQLLVASGGGDEAYALLIKACWDHLASGLPMDQLIPAVELLEHTVTQVERADLTVEALCVQARMAERLGDVARAGEHVERAVALAQRLGNARALGLALRLAVYLRRQLGQTETARRAAEESTTLARAVGSKEELATSLSELGFQCVSDGDWRRAQAIFTEVGQLASSPKSTCDGLMGRARVFNERGDGAAALGPYLEALEIAEQWGSLDMIAQVANCVGVCKQQLGDLEGAAQAYQEVERNNRLRGVVQPMAKANLATVQIERGHNAEAAELLEQILPRAQALSQGPLVQATHCFSLAAYAGLGDWERVDDTLHALAQARVETGFCERGLARFIDLGAERLQAAGQDLQAIAAWREAQQMWRTLDREDRVAHAQAALDRLVEGLV